MSAIEYHFRQGVLYISAKPLEKVYGAYMLAINCVI